MTLGPILHAKLAKYIQDYELSDVNLDSRKRDEDTTSRIAANP